MIPRHARFLALALLVAVASPAWAQRRPPDRDPTPQSYSIRGMLRFSDTERPADMTRVDLKRFTGETVATSFTRSNGEFQFTGLSSGVYYLVVEEEGYEPVREHIEIMNVSRSGILLYLTKIRDTSVPEPGSMVSARELALPRRARDSYQKGLERLHNKKDWQGSLTYFKRTLADAPEFYEAYHQMGVAYLELGQWPEAEEAFRTSIHLSQSRYPDSLFALSSILSTKGEFLEAETLVRQGLGITPSAWQGHYELARALLGLKRVEDALRSAEQARSLNDDFPPLYLVMANICIRQKNNAGLLEALDAYLRLEPEGPSSENARKMRDSVRRSMAQAQKAPPPQKP